MTSGYAIFSRTRWVKKYVLKPPNCFPPGYIQGGPGFLWKKSDNLKVDIAPATARLIFVSSEFTDVAALGHNCVKEFNASVEGILASRQMKVPVLNLVQPLAAMRRSI